MGYKKNRDSVLHRNTFNILRTSIMSKKKKSDEYLKRKIYLKQHFDYLKLKKDRFK